MTGDEPGVRYGTRVNHAGLQFSEFGKRGFDGVFDRTDLCCDFVSSIFDIFSAHDCSFPGFSAGVAVGLIRCRLV